MQKYRIYQKYSTNHNIRFPLFKWIYKNTNFHTYDYNIRNFLVSF